MHFSTNVESLLLYVLDPANNVADDARKICIKIYDHFQLNTIQIENASNVTKKVITQRIEKEKISLHTEMKEIQKEYVTILGIFAAIMLAFVGSFTFSTSVLNNVSNTNVYKLSLIALIIGVVFIMLISVLIDFLRELNEKQDTTATVRQRKCSSVWRAIIWLAILAIVCLICYTVSNIVFSESNQSGEEVVTQCTKDAGIMETTTFTDMSDQGEQLPTPPESQRYCRLICFFRGE